MKTPLLALAAAALGILAWPVQARAETAHVSGSHNTRQAYATSNYATHAIVPAWYEETSWELTLGGRVYETEAHRGSARSCSRLQVGTDILVERTKKGFRTLVAGKECVLNITGVREK